MSETVIKIENLYKQYRLGVISHRVLYKDVQSWWARVRGKDDPNRPLFNKHYVASEQNITNSDDFWALQNISFDVSKGEVMGIIGRNGAGKSTLLKILSRVTTPTRGMVKIKGRIASLLEVGTGFHPELTGRENIFLNGAILGMTKNEINAKFDEIVDFSGISMFIDTPVKRYSSGMYVRLAFAVAAHLEPEILIVDEVLAVGDAEFQKKCISKMDDVSKKGGRTVIFVSHNMDAVEKLCTKCVFINDGIILRQGETKQIISEYINRNFMNNCCYEQSSDKSKTINIRKIFLTNSTGINTSDIRYNEEFSVNIDYEVNEQIKNSIIWIAIRTGDEKIVFGSSDADNKMDFYISRAKGNYCTEIKIQGNFLNNGTYNVVVGAVSYKPLHSYDRIEKVSFKISDNTTSDVDEFNSRPGILKPIINWETNLED